MKHTKTEKNSSHWTWGSIAMTVIYTTQKFKLHSRVTDYTLRDLTYQAWIVTYQAKK